MSEEHRLYPRLVFVCPAQCSILESFPDSFPIGITDIGPEGFGFLCEQQLNTGVKLVIVVDLGKAGPVKFLAQVRWSGSQAGTEKYKIGAKIYDGSSEDLEKFIRFYYRGLVPGQGRRKKILIIQNNKERAKLLETELAKFRYDVVCAFDGRDGFNKYISERPDLILLDMAITKMDAYEICRRIRKLQNDDQVAIFAMLPKKKDKAAVEARQVGIQKYYLAQTSIEALMGEINKTLTDGPKKKGPS